jgi:hypothetical protein
MSGGFAVKKNEFTLFILILFVIIYGCSPDEKSINISGNILDQDNFDLSKSELQLIPIEKGEKIKVPRFSAVFENGQLVEVMYPSDYPKISLGTGAKFNYKIDKLSPGKYFLALYKLSPKFTTRIKGQGPIYDVRALSNDNDQCIVIDVEKEILPPFKIFFGNVNIPLIDKDTIIYGEFSDYNITKY